MYVDINAASKASGLPASTLRFYEEKGLIKSYGRKGLRRVFDVRILERLALISLGRGAGFSLEEMAAMFTEQEAKIDRALLLAKADALDKKIKELSSMRDGLRHAAVCSAENHFECPKFLRLLRIASKKRLGQTNPLKKSAKQKSRKK